MKSLLFSLLLFSLLAPAPAAQVPWHLDRIDQRTLPLDGAFVPNCSSGTTTTVYIVSTGIDTTVTEFGNRASVGWGSSTDLNGNGTKLASLVGGAIHGVDKTAKLVSVQVLNAFGSALPIDIEDGLSWIESNHPAGEAGVVVIGFSGSISVAIDDAVEQLINAGLTVVVAAGDSASDACNSTPAKVPGAITVGATDQFDAIWSQSNYGACVDLFAPGEDVVGAAPGGGVVTQSGTDASAALVAGAASLWLRTSGLASPAAVTAAMLGNATVGVLSNVGPGSPDLFLFVDDVSCPVTQVGGLPVSALGDATLSIVNGELVIDNIGASGLDGMSVAMPEGVSSGGGFEFNHLDFALAASGRSITLRSRGSLGGVPNTDLGVASVASVSAGLEFTADYTSVGATSVRMEFWDGDVLVATSESGSSTAKASLMELAPGCAHMCISHMGAGDWSDYFFDPSEQTPNHDLWVAGCSDFCPYRIRFFPTAYVSGQGSVDWIDQLELTSDSMVLAPRIVGISTRFQGADISLPLTWSGEMYGVPSSGTIGGSLNVVGGDDNEDDDVVGGSVYPSSSMRTSWVTDWDPSTALAGSSVSLMISEDPASSGGPGVWGVERTDLGSSASAGFEVETAFDFSGVGSSSYSMELYNDGLLVSSFAGVPNGSGLLMSRAAASEEVTYQAKTGPDLTGVLYLTETLVRYDVAVAQFSIDEVRVLPEAPTQALSDITDFAFWINDIPELSITGITSTPLPWTKIGAPLPGVSGAPLFEGTGTLVADSVNTLELSNAAPSALSMLILATSSTPVPFFGGTLQAFPIFTARLFFTSPIGEVSLPFAMPAGLPPGTELWLQWAIEDASALYNASLSNAIKGLTP